MTIPARPPRLPLALLLALTAWACGPESGPGPEAERPQRPDTPTATSPFPMRLLPEAPGDSDAPALLSESFSSLEGWWVVDLADRSVRPAEGHPALRHLARGVALTAPETRGGGTAPDSAPPGTGADDAATATHQAAHSEANSTTSPGDQASRPDLALVRLVSVPARTTVALTARLSSGGAGGPALQVTGLARPLMLFTLEADPSTGPAVGRAPSPDPSQEGARVSRRLSHVRVAGEAHWISLPDADGFARARVLQPAQPDPSLVAVVIAAGTACADLELRPRRELARLGQQRGQDSPPPDEPTLLSLAVGGERRPALLVPAGREHVLDLDPPPGARSLEWGVCLRPGAPADARAHWSVVLQADLLGAPDITLAEGDLPERDGEPRAWTDVSRDWPSLAAVSGGSTDPPIDPLFDSASESGAHSPASAPAGPRCSGACRLRFSVHGDDAVAFGQPLLRGGPPATHPNLLIVSLDTLRTDHLGYQGYPRPTSPALDAFAARAVAFLDTSSAAPYTLPSHVTMLSGWLPLRHGVEDSGADRLDARQVPYLPRLLSHAGYVCAAFTGGGFLSAAFGFDAGFDRFGIIDPILDHESELARARYERNQPAGIEQLERRADLSRVADWITSQGSDNWFALVHSYAAHDYAPPAADMELFDTQPGFDWGRDSLALQKYLNPDTWPSRPPSPAQVQRLTDLYDATIHFADRKLGEFLSRLERDGVLEHTVVVITSDHGEELFEHGGLRHSHTLYEEMLSVPLIVWDPRGAHGRRVAEAVSLADLTPSLLELLGLPDSGESDGRSLAGLVRGGQAPRRPPLLVGHVQTLNSRRLSLRAGRLKLIEGTVAGDNPPVRFPAPAHDQLFDLAADPAEQHDLSAERPADLARLKASLAAAEQRLRAGAVVDRGPGEASPELLEQLRQLGYVSGAAPAPDGND